MNISANIEKHIRSLTTARAVISATTPSAMGLKPSSKAMAVSDLDSVIEFLRSIDIHRAEIRAAIEGKRSE